MSTAYLPKQPGKWSRGSRGNSLKGSGSGGNGSKQFWKCPRGSIGNSLKGSGSGSWSCGSCGGPQPKTAKLKPYVYHTMSDNKLVKSLLDAATITGLVAGIGWIGRKIIKEDLTKDPSANAMNYVKFTAVMAGSIALKKYLEDQKILPTNV